MKKINMLIMLASFASTTLVAADPPASQNPTEPPVAQAPATQAPVVEPPAAAVATPPAVPKPDAPAVNPAPVVVNGNGELKMNFRGASLDTVLDYMSEAAGFIIVREARPKGTVDIVSTQPVSKEEAIDLLNTALNHNGYAAIRKGRTLTIVNKDEAKTKSLPVRLGGDPETIPDNEEMVTQIIPVRFVEVGQLMKDIQPLVPSSTMMTANESGNSLVITDVQSNIRKVAQIIKDIDMGAEDVTVVKVFHLSHADPNETADLLTSLFPDDSRSGSSQAPMTFGGLGGFRRFFGGGGGGPGGPGGFGPPGASGGNNSNGQNQRIRKRNRVVAVADPRTASVVVTAGRDMMEQIGNVIAELDPDPANQQQVAVFRLENAEPQDAMQVLQDIFQKTGTQNNRNTQNQNDALRTRSTQQTQQYNNNNNSSRGGNQGGRGGGGFGQ
jgi:general secretion pathway protein D